MSDPIDLTPWMKDFHITADLRPGPESHGWETWHDSGGRTLELKLSGENLPRIDCLASSRAFELVAGNTHYAFDAYITSVNTGIGKDGLPETILELRAVGSMNVVERPEKNFVAYAYASAGRRFGKTQQMRDHLGRFQKKPTTGGYLEQAMQRADDYGASLDKIKKLTGPGVAYTVADEMARWEKAYPLNDDGSLAASTVGHVSCKTTPITYEAIKAAYDKLNEREDARMATYSTLDFPFDKAFKAILKETSVNESCPICGAPRVAHETYQRLTKKGVSKTYEQHIYECGTVKFSGDVPKNHYGSRVEIACASID